MNTAADTKCATAPAPAFALDVLSPPTAAQFAGECASWMPRCDRNDAAEWFAHIAAIRAQVS